MRNKSRARKRTDAYIVRRDAEAGDAMACFQRSGTIAALPAREGEAKRYRVTVSTDTPQPGYYSSREVLSHAPGAVDLSRLTNGLAVTATHSDLGRGAKPAGSAALPVGRVHDLSLENGQMIGFLRIASSRPDLASDVEEGIITDVSVGAAASWDDVEEKEDGTVVIKRWQPTEASLVTYGNDPQAIIQRKRQLPKGGAAMDEDRRLSIQRLFSGLNGEPFIKLEREALYGDDSIEVIRGRVDAAMREQLAATAQDAPGGGRTSSGEDQLDKWATAVQRTLDHRGGLLSDDEAAAFRRDLNGNEVASMSLSEMARDYLRRCNVPVHGDPKIMIARALAMPAVMVQRAIFSHTTSDFSNLLAGTSDKALAKGFTEANESYSIWAADVNLSSFRQTSFPVLSTFSDLSQIPDTGDFTYGTFSDKTEYLTLAAYGKLFSIGRQAIINDDLNAFTRIPAHMGRAARRKIGDLAYAVLTSNPTMNETSRALFNTTDKTLAASGTAISTTSLDVATTAMGKQTDPAGNTLNIEPSYLIVPKAKETLAKVQMASEKDPGEGTTTSFDKPNPFRGRFQVVSDARLDADSATAWYLLSSKSGPVETIAIGWLNGIMRPRMEQETGFERDGIAFKVAIDAVAGPLDFRGAYKNAGA